MQNLVRVNAKGRQQIKKTRRWCIPVGEWSQPMPHGLIQAEGRFCMSYLCLPACFLSASSLSTVQHAKKSYLFILIINLVRCCYTCFHFRFKLSHLSFSVFHFRFLTYTFWNCHFTISVGHFIIQLLFVLLTFKYDDPEYKNNLSLFVRLFVFHSRSFIVNEVLQLQ